MQSQQRGLVADVPVQVPKRPGDAGGGPAARAQRDTNIRFTQQRCHVRLPWLQCQKEAPREAAVLLQVTHRQYVSYTLAIHYMIMHRQ